MRYSSILVVAAALSACVTQSRSSDTMSGGQPGSVSMARSVSRMVTPGPGETHFASIRQVTFGGENAEAYFSQDGKWITLQSTREGRSCDQQYVMRVDGSNMRRISDGRGKTTCGWFFPGGERLFFASTTAHDSACPPKPDPSKGYVWGLDRYDIYTVNRDGSDLKRITHNDVYTAEGVLSPDGKRIVFSSLNDCNLNI